VTDSRCVLTLASTGLDVVFEGEAIKVSEHDRPRQVADLFAAGAWRPVARDGALFTEHGAPSAGPRRRMSTR